MTIKRFIPEMIRGSIVECESAKRFLKTVGKFFAKNDNSARNFSQNENEMEQL